MARLEKFHFCVWDFDCKPEEDEAFVEKNSFGGPDEELGLLGEVLVPLQEALKGDVQEQVDLPAEQPVSCLLKVDQVPPVLPDARHLLVGTMTSQKSLHPPRQILHENHLNRDKADPNENQFIALKITTKVNLMLFDVISMLNLGFIWMTDAKSWS